MNKFAIVAVVGSMFVVAGCEEAVQQPPQSPADYPAAPPPPPVASQPPAQGGAVDFGGRFVAGTGVPGQPIQSGQTTITWPANRTLFFEDPRMVGITGCSGVSVTGGLEAVSYGQVCQVRWFPQSKKLKPGDTSEVSWTIGGETVSFRLVVGPPVASTSANEEDPQVTFWRHAFKVRLESGLLASR